VCALLTGIADRRWRTSAHLLLGHALQQDRREHTFQNNMQNRCTTPRVTWLAQPYKLQATSHLLAHLPGNPAVWPAPHCSAAPLPPPCCQSAPCGQRGARMLLHPEAGPSSLPGSPCNTHRNTAVAARAAANRHNLGLIGLSRSCVAAVLTRVTRAAYIYELVCAAASCRRHVCTQTPNSWHKLFETSVNLLTCQSQRRAP
jgi:hypothetical protein